MTQLPRSDCEYIGINVEALALKVMRLEALIKTLEERIISLERSQWLARPAPVPDSYYWEHG